MFGKTCCLAVFCLILIPQMAMGQIKKERVTRFLTALSADDMAGREAGTEGERKAAALIAQSFKEAGLSYFNGLDSYLQTFQTHQFTPVSRKLEINGVVVNEDRFVIATETEHLETTDLSQFKVFTPGSGGNFIGSFLAHQGPKLLHIGSDMLPMFQRFAGHFKSPQMSPEVDEKKLMVVLVSDVPEITSLRVSAHNKAAMAPMSNVVGVLKGKTLPDEFVMFSGHYDHLGSLEPVNGDHIANGADDDGSGTTAVVELAHYFKQRNDNARTLLFVAFTAEEKGGFGSQHMVKHIATEKIVAGINIEMIGKLSKFGSGQGYITGFDLSTLPGIMSEQLKGKAYGLHPDPYPAQNLFFRSDNASFAKLGVPAHSIGSGQIDQDNYYHTVDDEIETLDMAHLTSMIQAIAEASQPLVDGSKTPTRIDLELLKPRQGRR